MRVYTPDCSEFGRVARTLQEVQLAIREWGHHARHKVAAVLNRHGNHAMMDALAKMPYLGTQTTFAVFGSVFDAYDECMSHAITEDVLQVFAEKAQIANALLEVDHTPEQVARCAIPFPPTAFKEKRFLTPDMEETMCYIVFGDDAYCQKISNKQWQTCHDLPKQADA